MSLQVAEVRKRNVTHDALVEFLLSMRPHVPRKTAALMLAKGADLHGGCVTES